MAIFSFIGGWSNSRRRHSALGHKSPRDFEREAQAVDPKPSPETVY
jgi:transposase InsO family protein